MHHPALPYAQIAEFMSALRQYESVKSATLQFAILTAARPGEARGARWSEIDLAGAVWIIPAERMKAGREHRVPLSAPAVAVLDKMAVIRASEFVFPVLPAGLSASFRCSQRSATWVVVTSQRMACARRSAIGPATKRRFLVRFANRPSPMRSATRPSKHIGERMRWSAVVRS